MVGLSDIPIVGVAFKRLSEVTVDAGIRVIGYFLCYKSLVNQLNSEIENVKIEEVRVLRKVDAARNDGKIIEENVLKWQEEVENMKTLVDDELSGQRTSCTCFKVLSFPNLVTRFRLGRKAAHQAKIVANLAVYGRELVANEVGKLPALENLPTSNTTYHNFASREEAYEKLWEALVDENGDPIVGIYGMPGVGKTQMMEEAWRNAKDKNIFNKVARVNVSENIDVMSLQDKLAASLDCHLESKDQTRRASQLKFSLLNGGKTLVILDDVWDVIPLHKIGIPLGDGNSKGCKILLTSRKQDVCLSNNCKDPIEIKTLTDGEAWLMFKDTVGSSKIETLKDASLAEKVCKKCAALPLLIDAVGHALKFVTETLWTDALYQLQNHKFEEIEGINRQVYSCLQLSFEKLNVEARKCLLLCSLFPEDEDIEIKMLFDLATGSELLDTRRNIDAVIDILKSSSLLLQGKDSNTVKLHDTIRDVARSIAARDSKYAFLSVRCSSQFTDNVDYLNMKLLKLDLEEDNRLPDDLVCPNLRSLWLQGNNKNQQLSTDFFERFTNIRFLLLQGMTFPDYHQLSIHRLEKLSVLSICYCNNIPESFLSSIPKKLDFLCIWKCHLQVMLELPELKNLRKLELLHNSKFNVVGKAISSLSSLEELKILGRFRIQDDAEIDATSIFAQLSQLTRLRNLTIELECSKSYPDQDIVNKLVEFDIYVGSGYHYGCLRDSSKKSIRFHEINDIENGWIALVERAEKVELQSVDGLANGFSYSNMGEAFAFLRELKIERCYKMEHLANWDERYQPVESSFSNLTSVYIYGCSQLKYLFSASVAKCLFQLQQLQVHYCYAIEQIIRFEEGPIDQEEIISFPNLKELHLQCLPRLRSWPSSKVAFSSLEVSESESELRRKNIYHKHDNLFSQLKILEVIRCDEMEYVIPVTKLHMLKNLEELRIVECKTLKNVFHSSSTSDLEDIGNGSLVFPGLKSICMKDLPKLESLWTTSDHQSMEIDSHRRGSYFIPKVASEIQRKNIYQKDNYSFSQLKVLQISRCDKLEYVILLTELHGFKNLEELNIEECKSLKSVIHHFSTCNLHEISNRHLVFPALREVYMTYLPKLECLWSTYGRPSDPVNFHPGKSYFISKVTLPNVKKMKIVEVKNCFLTEGIELGRDDSPPKLNTLSLYVDDQEIELPSQWLLQLENIERLHLNRCWWSGHSVFKGTPTFRRLKKLEIKNCGVTSIFRCSSLAFLQQLQILSVSGCPLLEEIGWGDEPHGCNNKKTSLPRLKKIILLDLPKLNVCGIFKCNLPALEQVRISECGLSTLFTSSALTYLQKLCYLEVSDCPLLGHIVEDEMHVQTPSNTITLLCLKEIRLSCLSSLRSFSRSPNYVFDMPALQNVIVYECLCMEDTSTLLTKCGRVKY